MILKSKNQPLTINLRGVQFFLQTECRSFAGETVKFGGNKVLTKNLHQKENI